MGCALATLAFYSVSTNGVSLNIPKTRIFPVFGNPRVETSLFGFGCPPVGNSEFVGAWASSFGFSNRTWRIVHNLDLMNHIGNFFHLSSYDQIPREVFYQGDGFEPYTVCDGTGEDPKCSTQNSFWIWSWNMEDNYKYLGHRMGCCDSANKHCAFPDLSLNYTRPYPYEAESTIKYPFTWALSYENNSLNPMATSVIACFTFLGILSLIGIILLAVSIRMCHPNMFSGIYDVLKKAQDRARLRRMRKERKELLGPENERNWDSF